MSDDEQIPAADDMVSNEEVLPFPALSALASADNSELFEQLSRGFAALREHQYGPSDAQIQLESTPEFLRHAIVNFIDPTSSSSAAGTALRSPTNVKASLELYEKLTFVLQTEYNSTLKKVPYTNARNGASGVIDSLKIKTYMTGSQGGLILEESSHIPWADTGSATGQGADPSEWHKGPYCHVYLAACDNLEHYRTRVKPSIQAFLSQIDAVAKHTASQKDTATEVLGSQYVIVFVPTGNGNKTAEEGLKAGPGGGKLGMWASARQRIAREGDKGDREVAGGTATTSETADLEDISPGQRTLMQYLPKVDKEIMRRLSKDFSAGIVCQLSTLADGSDDELGVELKTMEWKAFLKGLGTAITNGFRERCRKYDEEIRKLDQMRGASKNASTVVDRFDYSAFFLVKESLAFSYQQMGIHTEASLQYDELQAVLPELKASAKVKSGIARFAFSANGDSSLSSMSHGSISGDSVAFRERLRSVKDLQPLAQIIQHYIFARQTELSFKTKTPVEVLERCLLFVQAMYKYKCELLGGKNDKINMSRVESWALHFCWDVKKSCESFYSDGTESMSMLDLEGPRLANQTECDLARCLCRLLELARTHYLRIGDHLLDSNPIRLQSNILTRGFTELWAPWNPRMRKSTTDDEDDGEDVSESELDTLHIVDAPVGDFLQSSLVSTESYLSGYLRLLKVIEATNRSAERRRCAASIAIEMAAIYAIRNDVLKAALALRAASDVYSTERWEIISFLALLRLAYYQRQLSTADEYFYTLVQIFTPATAKAAPPRALITLQRDLEAVLSSSLVSQPKLMTTTMFIPVLGLDGVKSSGHGISTRGLLKSTYVIGSKADVTLALRSSLPESIEVQEIAVNIVPYRTYVSAMDESKSNGLVIDLEEDSIKSLSMRGPLSVAPGDNKFVLDWYPMSPGQFVLGSVTVKWHGVRFSYAADSMKCATVRLDILPADPTQSISLTPGQLLPDHVQPVTISFDAGTDIVKQASMKLVCSPGLLLLPPGENADNGTWSASCDLPLPQSVTGKPTELTTVVRSDAANRSTSQPDSPSQVLNVTVNTSYHSPLPTSGDTHADDTEEGSVPLQQHTLKGQISTLLRNALTVEESCLIFYDRKKTTASVTLQCNTPACLIIRNWTLSLPASMELTEDGDFNAALLNARVEPNERVTFAFDCSLVSENHDPSWQLIIDFDDEKETRFKEVLKLMMPRTSAAIDIPPLCEPVPVRVVPSALSGAALAPLNISYEVDVRSLSALSSDVKYRLDFDAAAWIVCGKCQGIINTGVEQFKVTVVIIPARPGINNAFPRLELIQLDSETNTDAMSLATNIVCDHNAFHSLSVRKHTTVAVPIPAKSVVITTASTSK
jgi:hypothetical protein